MRRIICLATLVVLVVSGASSYAGKASLGKHTTRTRAVSPKPLSKNVTRGLAWLVAHQQRNGGWSQGEESSSMGSVSDNIRDLPNVADTCIATLALVRAGSTPNSGRYAENARRAVAFVCSEIEESDAKSMSITRLQGTRVQTKLGPYIDTFMASLLLAEVKGRMPDARSEKRAQAAARKVLDKIARNQKEDGTWGGSGWAPVLSQSMASKALNRAAQVGLPVDERARTRAEGYARSQFDRTSDTFKGEGSAGVALYSAAANVGAMQDSANTNVEGERQARVALRSAKTKAEREEAQQSLVRIQGNAEDLRRAKGALTKNLQDEQFVAGFGSNGGEEFLSYMNIGESLVVEGGKEWQEWDASIARNLSRVQNTDGSWSGHHCITGRTFCTAAALLVLTVDRAPAPLAQGLRKGQ